MLTLRAELGAEKTGATPGNADLFFFAVIFLLCIFTEESFLNKRKKKKETEDPPLAGVHVLSTMDPAAEGLSSIARIGKLMGGELVATFPSHLHFACCFLAEENASRTECRFFFPCFMRFLHAVFVVFFSK